MGDSASSDYLRPLRRSRLLIVFVTLVTVGASIAFSLSQDDVYSSSASLQVRDDSQALAIIGTSAAAERTGAEQAQLAAQTLITPGLLRQVKADLGTPLTTDQLRQNLGVTADTESNLVTIGAQGKSPGFAARLARAVSQRGADRQNGLARSRFAVAARDLDVRLKVLRAARQKDPELEASYKAQIGRLRSLVSVTTPVQVAKPASVPTSPVSPKPVRNAIFALVIGLFLGVILAYVRAAFDRTLHGAAEIGDELGLPLVAEISPQALGRAGFSTSGRGPLSPSDAEAFRILRANIEGLEPQRAARSILVTSAVPQEGKSTVAASLAYAMAAAGSRTLLLECDLREPSLADRLGVDPAPGLAEYLRGEVAPADVLQSLAIEPGQPDSPAEGQLVAILAGKPPAHPAELLQSDAFGEVLESLKQAYDVVIVDTSPLLPVADTLAILDHAERVLLCVRSGKTELQQAKAATTALERHGSSAVGIVVTGVTGADRGYYGYYGQYGDAVAETGGPVAPSG